MAKDRDADIVIDESALEGAFVRIPLYVLHDSRVSASMLRLYAHLKSYAFRGDCFPGVRRLALEWGVNQKTIMRNVKELSDIDLIDVVRRPNKTNRYILRAMAKVYFETLDPPTLKDHFLESIRKRGLVEKFERSLNMDIGYGDVEPENGTEEQQVEVIERRKSLGRSLIASMDKEEEKAEEARRRAKKNRDLRKRRGPGTVPSDGGDTATDEDRITAKSVEAVWRSVCRELRPDNKKLADKWGITDLSIAKRLIETWGGADTVHCIEQILRRWNDFHNRYKSVDGVPKMKVIARFSDLWFSEIIEGRDMRPLSRDKRSLREGEFEDDGHQASNIGFLR